MPGLGDTTAMLARLRRQQAGMMAGFDGDAESRLVETAQFGPNPGALRMLSHVPARLPAGAPLVVVLHGCTQRGGAYAEGAGWLSLADRHHFAVLVPEQTPDNNFNRCFNWFEPADTARGRGEAASIAAMVADMVKTHRLDPARVFVTGLSAGGAMASALLAAYPDVFAGGAIIAGLPYGVADNLQQALGAMSGHPTRARHLDAALRRAMPQGGRLPRITIWHGELDHTVAASNASAIAAQWARAQGLPAAPSEIEALPGRTRAVWRAPGTGEALIESNLIAGLDHGTPLATHGPDAAGEAGPYLLEAGVSSSLESLRFWGLAPAAAHHASPAHKRPAAKPATAAAVGDGVMRSVAGKVPDKVHKVIETALRKAGLMG